MKHKRGFNPLERRSAQRKALLRSLATSLFKYERIKTTLAKARAVQSYGEPLITRAKTDSVHNRRLVSARLYEEGIVAKLFNNIAPRMKERAGGYTRVLKIGNRKGDAAELVYLQLVDWIPIPKENEKDKNAKKKAGL